MLCHYVTRLHAILTLLTAVLALPLSAQEARWKELNAQVEQLQKQGKYAEALPAAQEAVHVAEAAFGPENPSMASALNKLGEIYLAQANQAEAELLFRRALAIREKALQSEDPDVAVSLRNLAELYRAQSKYAEAEPLYKRSLAIREKALGPDHSDVAKSLNDLAILYWQQDRYAEAEPFFRRALSIRENALGSDHPDVAATLNSLANLYWFQGRYVEAEPLYNRALVIFEKTLGPEHPDVARSLNNLAGLYNDQGRYAEAEPFFRRALAIREKALGPEHPDVGRILNNLATLYVAQGKYAEAEPLYKRSLAILEKGLGPEHPDVGQALNNLGALYMKQGPRSEAELYHHAEAESLYKRSLAVREKALGSHHRDVGQSVNNLADLYKDQGRYGEAELLYKRALAIREEALGPLHPDVARSLNSLANLYMESRSLPRGQYLGELAEADYQQSLAIREKALGAQHPDVRESLLGLATLYYARGLSEKAEPYFLRSLENVRRQLQYSFTYMTEKGRLSFLNTASQTYSLYFSFCLTNKDRNALLGGRMYDVLLQEKGLVANSIASLRTQIASSGDKESLELFEELFAKRTQLAALLSVEPRNREGWRNTVDRLDQEANDIEQELVRRSSALAEQKRFQAATWKEVQKTLGEGEAAVEFVRFRFHDGERWTDKTYYVALVVTPQRTVAPSLVLLGDAATMEGAPLRLYRNWVRRSGPAPGPLLYQTYWKPLEKALAGCKRVYLSPDGFLNEISLGVIPSPTGRLLMEKYDLRIVSSTRDLLRERPTPSASRAVLIGNPRFDLGEVEQRAAAARLQKTVASNTFVASPDSRLRSRDKQATRLSPLPGTRVELERVRSVLKKHNWKVDVYTGDRALVETVKHVQGPRVLHLATHGFFLSDQSQKGNSSNLLPSGAEEPMLRSGLYLAGANRTLSGATSTPDLDDGILTAYEATGLNLQGTELVVLSGCETGLGQVKNGEGVFGLRRALQEAGALAVLMSLWPVPDRETQELMTRFYEHWLSGQEKPAALRAAQFELREIVKARYGRGRPFYWGGFVLVGN